MSDQSRLGRSDSRELIRLLLRISRAGSRKGWSPELEAVWEQAKAMALEGGIPWTTIAEIRGPSQGSRIEEEMFG